ncbi:carbohydrate kinase [Actinotalea sp. M2MS4P-6]|uniref:FGGY-family carbohydrate kinase n=1 Tax=Actinotalea sp. M2MS4P-6 TaxID=2983762 RepID=UPI0021E4BB87|nr:FGGY-family carbohydrate kinase [Actinotalea sp. M2MS4P-6]MCV2395137.1 carbohydrate kinase [Actinotalea sp. M2MS4P-6]
MGRYVIGVDNGGTFIKAGMYDQDGTLVALAKERNVVRALAGGRVEVDQEELWQANCRCVRRLMADSGVPPEEVECLGFAGQGKGLWLLGDRGELVRAGITSADDRAWRYAEQWKADGRAAAIFPATLQGLFSSHPVTILRWLKDHEPEVYDAARWVFSMKDYLVFRATGEVVSDYCNQSGNSFINLATREYDPTILEKLGVPEFIEKLPPLFEAAEVVGSVTAAAAAELGCAGGTAVIAGMFDVDASAVAAGLVDQSVVCLITGTAGVNVYAAPEPVADGSVAMNSLYCIPQTYLVEEGSNTSVGTMEWVADTLFGPELRAAWDDRSAVYGQMAGAARSVEVTSSDAVFLPFLQGDGFGGRSGGVWAGLSSTDRREHLTRAAFEGVVFAHRRHIDRLLRHRPAPRAYRIAGGAARSAHWVQLFADVLQRPIEVTTESELGVKGVGIAAGIATGVYTGFADAVAKLAPANETVEPDAAMAEHYDRKYDRFSRAAERLRDVWAD